MSKFFEQWSCLTIKQKIFFVFRELLGIVLGTALCLSLLWFEASASEAAEPEQQGAATVASCDHSWSTSPFGVCELCGMKCSHPNYSSKGSCTICLHPCAAALDRVSGFTHSFFKGGNPDGYCDKCNYKCQHSLTSKALIGWNDLAHHIETKCNICGIISDSSWFPHDIFPGTCYCTKCEFIKHTFVGGVCTVCALRCSHPTIDTLGRCTFCSFCVDRHTFVSDTCSYCGYVCTEHEFESYSEKYNSEFHYGGVRCTKCQYSVSMLVEHVMKDGFCTDCNYVCKHFFKGNECTMCGKLCDHAYNNNLCSKCGWACPGGHDYIGTTGVCRICDYFCQHSVSSRVYIVVTDTTHHWERVCGICNKVFNSTNPVPHDLRYDPLKKGCVCSVVDCKYFNKHVPSDEIVVDRVSYDPYNHKTVFSYGCCDYTYYSLMPHEYSSDSNFTCIWCGDYSIVAENYYDIGYLQGLGDGSKKDTSDLFSSLIFSVYDGMSTTFTSLFDYNLFGFNFAGFLFFLIALVVVFYFAKKVL